MAGKISELAALTDPAATDLIEVLDVSDTSMAASGTNKRLALGAVSAVPQGRWIETFSYMVPGAVFNTHVNAAMAANYQFMFPIVVTEPLTVTALATHVATGAGSTNLRMGIYTATPSFASPATLLVDAGTIDTSTTGLKEAAVSLTLSPGRYFIASISNGAPTLNFATLYSSMGTPGLIRSNCYEPQAQYSCVAQATSYGPLAASLGYSNSAANPAGCAVKLKVTSP